MRIHISHTAQLELPAYPDQTDIDVPEGITVAGFLEMAGVRKEHRKFILPMINNTKVNSRSVLQEGDSLFLLIPVGGG